MAVEGVMIGPTGKQAEARFFVDSGAAHTLLPEKVWKVIEFATKQTYIFTLTHSATIQRNLSEGFIKLPQREERTLVIFGEPGDELVCAW